MQQKALASPSEHTILSKNQIISLLDQHRISRARWGKGSWRTLDYLVKSHQEDQIYFRRGSNPLTIDVHAVVVIVLYQFGQQWLELYEDHQLSPDGTPHERHEFNGIAETIHRGETLEAAVRRCLKEELKFRDHRLYTVSTLLKTEHRAPVPSEKWRGIHAAYHRYIFECVIDHSLFRNIYVEKKKDGRRIIFTWQDWQLSLSA